MQILVSKGHGAGWSTWSEKPKQVAEYEPIIDFVLGGGDLCALDPPHGSLKHPLVIQMMDDLDLDHFHAGGALGLVGEEVTEPYRIDEYDGYEIVHSRDTEEYW